MSIRTKRNSRRFIAAAAAVAVAASTFAFSPSASAVVGVQLDTMKPSSNRYGGPDRFATAAAIAQKAVSDGTFASSCLVVIVNGNSFADGLSAASITSQLGGVILLSQANSVPAITVSTIESIADRDCTNSLVDLYIVGGRTVISETVADALRAHPNVQSVTRYAGANRYTTSLAVAEGVRGDFCASDLPFFASVSGPAKTVIVATGRDFPDALAAGPLAYNLCAPIILHDGETPSGEMKIFLEGYEPDQAFIVGGTAVVPASIQSALVAAGLGVTRLAGANRFETAVAVADYMKADAYKAQAPNAEPTADPFYANGVILANGRNFPDALAAAPLSVLAGGNQAYPILLVETNSIPAATAAWHIANSDTLQRVWAVGGQAAVSNAVLNGAIGAATAVRPVATSATTSNELLQATITLKPSVDKSGSSVVTLSATAAIPGAAGNDWTVKLIQQDPPASPNIVISTATKTITATHNYNLLTGAQFVAFWNTGGANVYFTAAANGTNTFDADWDAEEEDQATYSPKVSGEGSKGGTEVTIDVTFSRTVKGRLGVNAADWPQSFRVFTGTSVSDTQLWTFDTFSPTPVAPGTDVTYIVGSNLIVRGVYNTEDFALVPVVGETSLRIGEGGLSLSASPYADAKSAVTNPSQQLVLTAPS